MGARLCGEVFSDLGEARAFMTLDWVQRAIERGVGFAPYPATLNLRLRSDQDRALWNDAKKGRGAITIDPPDPSFCAARLYPAAIEDPRGRGAKRLGAAVLLPLVAGYPEDKLEVVAPVQVKESWGVSDGDELVVELGAE